MTINVGIVRDGIPLVARDDAVVKMYGASGIFYADGSTGRCRPCAGVVDDCTIVDIAISGE